MNTDKANRDKQREIHKPPELLKWAGSCSRVWWRFPRVFIPLSAFICVHLWFQPLEARGQDREGELVANLAGGRVLVSVAKDGIVIATIEERVEAGSRPPVVLAMGSKRVAILLGAVEWGSPAEGPAAVRIASALPEAAAGAARPGLDPSGEHAGDIETLGMAFLEKLRVVVSRLHHRVEMGAEEPLVEVVLVNWLDNYGPEIWTLRYRIAQDAMRGEYWRTRILRPSYNQLYPPDKGQPRTLVEISYEPDGEKKRLLARLRSGDPALARIRASDPRMEAVAQAWLNGQSSKVVAEDTAQFLRAALPPLWGSEAKFSLGTIRERTGLDWIVPPPREAVERAGDEKPREPGAPTLRKP